MTYYPYGEEKTSTADGREKFATYTRDSAGVDYADQRYYGVGTGRFNSPDPSMGVDPFDPASWNRYLYVGGDPINFRDRAGTCKTGVDDEDENPDPCQSGPGQGKGKEQPRKPVDKPTGPHGGAGNQLNSLDGVAERLRAAIGELAGDCQKVLPSQQTLLDDAKDLQFFDARATASGNQTVAQIAPALAPYNPSGTLQTIVGGANAVILTGPPNGSASSISSTVVLGLQFFLDPETGKNSNFSVGQGTVLIHELLHYGVQMGDDLFVSSYGIKQQQYESSSSAINRWLQNDCKN
jgi:RHS repeat-associated protein